MCQSINSTGCFNQKKNKIQEKLQELVLGNFKYEGISTFCFICGMIGHNENFCKKLFDTLLEKIEKLYGIWMRAESRRRMHTIGDKWLRPDGIFLATSSGKTGGRSGSKVVAVADARDIQNRG